MSTTNRNKVYITTNRNHTVLYVGSSSDLSSRIHKHKTKFYKGFTSKYNVDKLVYFESFPRITEAHKRERQVKKYRREKKEALINAINPEWNELDPNSDGN
ncbi:MAG: GIY-YIG nuclease family protein [Brumimicrobium sp.]